jgi:WhiB family transcriptional regulator, redox-sensing transcriptional regulator
MFEYVTGVDFSDAVCSQVDPELFFLGANDARWATIEAKKICATCPIIYECLQEALASNEEYGIWGGTTPSERKAIVKKAKNLGVVIKGIRTDYGKE